MLRSLIAAATALLLISSAAEARQRHRVPAAAKECNISMPCDFSNGSPAQMRESARVARGRYVARDFGIGGVAPKPRKSS